MIIVLAGPIVTQLPIALRTHLREENAAEGYLGLYLIQAFTTRDRKPNTLVEGERKAWAGPFIIHMPTWKGDWVGSVVLQTDTELKTKSVELLLIVWL